MAPIAPTLASVIRDMQECMSRASGELAKISPDRLLEYADAHASLVAIITFNQTNLNLLLQKAQWQKQST
jgi:hypothetical protein